MYSTEEIARLCEDEIQAACREHAGQSGDAFAMRYGKRTDWPVRAMAELIDARKRAAGKLLGWPIDALLFDRLGIEQCSHLACARQRATVIDGGQVIDCCGGLGIDSAALAERDAQVLHCEIDFARQHLAAYNHGRLGLDEHIDYHGGDGIERMLAGHWDLAFVDPSRRDVGGRRSVDLDRLQPSPTAVHRQLLSCCAQLIYKLAPATDETAIRNSLGDDCNISWISVDGELKECQVSFAPGAAGRSAICLAGDGSLIGRIDGDGPGTNPAAGNPGDAAYLIICDPAINKAGLGDRLASAYGWQTWRAASGLYLADQAPAADLALRSRRILGSCTCQAKAMRQLCQDHGIEAAGIIDRGAGISATRLQRESKLPPSDSHQLICSEQNGQRLTVLCSKT